MVRGVEHELGAYIASYTEDYDTIGNVWEKDRSITVWITTGRDQAQVMKSLIDDIFTPETGYFRAVETRPARNLAACDT